MTPLQRFILAKNSQFIEILDSNAKNQCVDLALAWVREVLPDFKRFGVVPAYEIFTKFKDPRFTHIKNEVYNRHNEGDLVVWSAKYGPSGHVAVATGLCGEDWFEAFSQNDPTGSPCVIKRYKYTHVLGWVRINNYKPQEADNSMEDKKLADEMRKLIQHNSDWKTAEAVKKEITKRDNAIGEMERSQAIREKDISVNYMKKSDHEKELHTLREKYAEDVAKVLRECQTVEPKYNGLIEALATIWKKALEVIADVRAQLKKS